MKKILLLLVAMISIYSVAWAQKTVSGIVKDQTGPLESVSITEKGMPGNGTTSDRSGKFTLRLRGTSNTLIFNFVGFTEQEVDLRARSTVEVILQTSTQSMEDVVVVGFGKKKRITNTGAVSAINAAEIRNVPTSNVQNTLAGRLPGFFSQQRSGQPGRDASDFFIRGVSSLNAEGNRPLIIVDDIEYTYEQLSQINVNEIENISILKDASTTAIYGIKGANGVLVVTTRRGTSGRPKVNLRVETGIQTPVRTPVFLNSYETALLVNEALRNDDLPLQFTEEDIELFRTGEDPFGHPDVNWYNAIFKPNSLQANTNVDVSGGNDNVKYFMSGGALTQNGSLRNFADPLNQVNNNYYYRRYNFRSNVDIRATKSLNLRLDMSTRFADINQPRSSNAVREIYDFSKIHPYSAPFINPNGSYAFARDTRDQLPTINARLATQGYNRNRRVDYNLLFSATQQLDAITRGLSFSGRVSYSGIEQNSRQIFREDSYPPSYYFNPEDETYTIDPRGRYRLGRYRTTGNIDIYDKSVNLQAYLNYDRKFGDHQFSSLILFNQQSSASRADVPANFRGYSIKIGYNYKEKYLLDFNNAYNGSDRFNENNRYGWFPAVGAGWSISREEWFDVPFINLLKIRASYGLVGSDVVAGNRYLYNQVYNTGGGYQFGENQTAVPTIFEGSLGNDNVTWEKARKADIGLDANLFNDKLSLTIDYFHDIRYDQLITRGSVPLILGVAFAPTNIGEVRNSGWDGQISYRNNIGQVQFNVTGVFSIAKNEVLFMDETSPSFPWLSRTGLPIGQPFGYTTIGFYENERDILESAKPNTGIPIQPGDLKYRDLNGDNIIDEYDLSPIGQPNLPNTTLGLTLGASYKGFSISALFQGSMNYSFSIVGTGIETFQSQFQPVHQLRWTPATGNDSKFPRLTSNPTTVNSSRAYPSDFWQIDARYIRLKTLELGYQVPNNLLPFKLNNARLYMSGYNLFTWTNYDLYQQDPEVGSNTAGDAYFNQRVVNFGLQIGF